MSDGMGGKGSVEASGAIRQAIVIGLDGSAASWSAFSWGCAEARRRGAPAIAAYVSPNANFGGPEIAGFPWADIYGGPKELEHATKLGAQAISRAAEGAVQASFIHATGDAGAELLRIALDVEAALIVVGRSKACRHKLRRSLGRRLIARSTVQPIVVVP